MKGTIASGALACAALLLVTSCSDPAPPGVAGGVIDVETTPDTEDTSGTTPEIFSKPDTPSVDTGADISGPVEGGPGWPCAENNECDSGWCVPTPNGEQCSEFCLENCTIEGWSCKSVQNLAGSDNVSICLPDFIHLCDPCISDTECNSGLGDTGDRCLEREDGLGSFCGGACSDNIPCPSGYTCETYDLGAGGTVRQCTPEAGVCECSQAAVIAGDSTTCSLTNEFGTCTGIRSCTEEGLTSCDAANPSEEVCDGIDNDCDGMTDEQNAADCVVYFKDVDNDLYGVDGDSRCLCEPNDVYRAPQGGDCDDTNNDKNPGEDEVCNGKDDDCDSETDEQGAVGCTKYWLDEDDDDWGAGEAEDFQCLCEAEGNWTALKPDDCLDDDATAFPGAPETCTGVDSNCDGQVGPENTPGCIQFYLDQDEDGFGVTSDARCLCGPDGFYTTNEDGDCNDELDTIKPGAVDICDTIDNDCDGTTDPADAEGCQVYYQDLDNDQFGNPLQSACLCEPSDPFDTQLGTDCNDQLGTVNPDGVETCGNNIDDDCDGETDEANALGCQTFYADVDVDGYGDPNDSACLCAATAPYVETQAGDCNDTLPFISPEATETCNAVDDNCNGETDEEDSDGCTTYFLDGDDDDFGVQDQQKCLCAASGSFTATASGDCVDNNPDVNPDGTETCGNNLDDDCNGSTDEPGASGCQVYFEDFDKDGFGVTGTTVCACAPAFPFTAEVGGDCKDTNDEIKPGQTEVCNGADDDCNGTTDDEGAEGCSNYFLDTDDDNFGVPGSAKCLCAATGDYTADKGGDCNDGDLLNFPGETCAPPSCAGFLVTAPTVCAGTGDCNVGGATAPCPGGYVCENDEACKTACTGNEDCQPGTFCVAGACSGKKLDGAACVSATECQSDHCQNGFCCASGDCCGGAPSHCNDDNLCTNDICTATFQCDYSPNGNVCAAPTCDGNVFTGPQFCEDSACTAGGAQTACTTDDPCLTSTCTLSGCVLSNATAGTLCAEATCTGATITASLKCDGAGGCAIGGSTSLCPGGFICNEAGDGCLSLCETDEQCQSGWYCDASGGSCLPKKGDGEPCTDDAECDNVCNNGFCCDGETCCSKNSDCDDDNICTTDVCNTSFECENTANTVQCAGGFCDAGSYVEPKFCAEGDCTTGGTTVACETNDPCLVDTCGPSGCGVTPSPIGTTCELAVCNGFMITAEKKCDGTGGCELGGSMKPCAGGYTCAPDGLECLTTCVTNNECQSGLYCDSGVCLPKKGNGDVCGDNAECQTGYCANGFCCTNGTCCAQAGDCDDGNVCTTDSCNSLNKCSYTFNTVECEESSCDGNSYTAPKTCFAGACTGGGATSECTGTNPCFNYGCGSDGCELSFALAGTVCSTATCVGSSLTNASTCNPTGQCISPGTVSCPGGYICANSTSCRTFCTDDSQCQSDYYCDSSASCQPKREDGDPCSQNKQCDSGYCANGFCCAGGNCCSKNSDCDDGNVCTTDTCSLATNICSYANNSNVCQSGSCSGLTYTDKLSCSGGTCSAGGAQQDCSGANPCKVYGCTSEGCTVEDASAGLICAQQACSGFSLTAVTTCDGNGTCNSGGTTAPCAGGYMCLDNTQCRSSCTLDSHCQSGFFCGAGICQPKRDNGDACVGANQCNSGYCANGYCCNGPTGLCCSQGFHCDDGNPCTDDTCAPNNQCTYANNGNQCDSPTCDGLTYTGAKFCDSGACTSGGGEVDCDGSNVCKIYSCTLSGCSSTNASQGVQCEGQGCAGFTLTQAKTCNGSGTCSSGGFAAPCPGAFVCADGTNCRTNCLIDDHCQPGFYCSGQSCFPKREDGDSCSTNEQCESDYCGGGFCCENDGSDPQCCGGGNNDDCDDGNVCTINTCGAGFVCNTQFSNFTECEPATCNAGVFQMAGTCFNGTCLEGSTSTCQPAEACRTYPCDPAQGCVPNNLPAGTPCEVGTCSGFTLTASKQCDGSGQCVTGGSTGPCPGGFNCLNNSECRTSCSTNDDCQPGLICEDGLACVSKKANGDTCSTGTDCLSGYCNSGFCCDSGTCCQTATQCNDSNVCTDDACTNNSCAYTNNTAVCGAATCDGLLLTQDRICSNGTCPLTGQTQDCAGPNVCQVYSCAPSGCLETPAASGTQCDAAVCTGSTLTQAKTCNGAGLCSVGGATAPCAGNLKCASSTTCLSTCSSDGDCINGYYCATGQCLAKKSSGQTCGSGNQCISGYCNSGICCAAGECCTTANDCEDGNVCTTHTCNNFQCSTQFATGLQCEAGGCVSNVYTAPKTCNTSGQCVGGGAQTDCSGSDICFVYGCDPNGGCSQTPKLSGTICAAASCTDGTLTQAVTCNGVGDCNVGGDSATCSGNYSCLNSTACRVTCSIDDHCQDGFFCSGGNCVSLRDNGEACSLGTQCLSGYCNNGYCCSDGTCCAEASNCFDGNVCTDDTCQGNQCVFVNNNSTCGSGTCNGLTYTSAQTCQNGACTGGGGTEICSGTDACKVYGCTESGCTEANAPAGTQCVPASCVGSTLTTAQQCNSTGTCATGGVSGACPGNYSCQDSVSCFTTCSSDAQCQSGHYCQGGACLLKKSDGSSCSGAGQCQSGYCEGGICCAGGTCCINTTPCNDANVCTSDQCVNNMCVNTNVDGTTCASGFCTGLSYTSPKTCNGGACVGGGTITDCTSGGQQACTEYTCSNVAGCGVSNAAEGTICQDAACTNGVFSPAAVCNGSGACLPSTPQDCDDGDVCTGVEGCSTTLGCTAGNPNTEWVCGDNMCNAECESADSCAADCTCTVGYQLTTGEIDTWSTAALGSTVKFSEYGCDTTQYPGREYVYRWTAPVTGQVALELRGADANTDILILSDIGVCNPQQCIGTVAGTGSTAAFAAVAGTSYYFVVDRKVTGSVNFEIYARYSNTCNVPFIENWDRDDYPRGWTGQANWQTSQDSPLGPTHVKFTGTPVLTNFSRTLTSPLFDTSACTNLTVGVDWRFTENTADPSALPHAGVTMTIQVSTDGGTNWTDVFSYDTGSGASTPPFVSETLVGDILAGSTSARLRLVVAGDTTEYLNRFQVDNIVVQAP